MAVLTDRSTDCVYKRLYENPSRMVVSAFYNKRTRKKLSEEFEKIIKEVYANLVKKSGLLI